MIFGRGDSSKSKTREYLRPMFHPDKIPLIDFNYQTTELFLQSQKKLMGQIKQNWTELKNFDTCFCVIFGWYDQSFISEKDNGH